MSDLGEDGQSSNDCTRMESNLEGMEIEADIMDETMPCASGGGVEGDEQQATYSKYAYNSATEVYLANVAALMKQGDVIISNQHFSNNPPQQPEDKSKGEILQNNNDQRSTTTTTTNDSQLFYSKHVADDTDASLETVSSKIRNLKM